MPHLASFFLNGQFNCSDVLCLRLVGQQLHAELEHTFLHLFLGTYLSFQHGGQAETLEIFFNKAFFVCKIDIGLEGIRQSEFVTDKFLCIAGVIVGPVKILELVFKFVVVRHWRELG